MRPARDRVVHWRGGSAVLRGQLLVLPMDKTFLYIQPIYLKAAQASIPQLQKIVLALGDKLVYADTYDKALEQLSGGALAAPAETTQTTSTTNTPATTAPKPNIVQSVRDHLNRYRQFAGQGKWSEAGKELEAIEALVK